MIITFIYVVVTGAIIGLIGAHLIKWTNSSIGKPVAPYRRFISIIAISIIGPVGVGSLKYLPNGDEQYIYTIVLGVISLGLIFGYGYLIGAFKHPSEKNN